MQRITSKHIRSAVFAFATVGLLGGFTGQAQASPAANSKVNQLEIAKRGPSGQRLCIAVDITKIGIIAGAEKAKVEPCNNIQEQHFRTIYTDAHNFRIQTAAKAPDGQAKCLDTDITKITQNPNAKFAKFGDCRNIPEQAHQKFRENHDRSEEQLVRVGDSGYCLDVYAGQYGIHPKAHLVKFSPCARVDEQWVKFTAIAGAANMNSNWSHLQLFSGKVFNTNTAQRFATPKGQGLGLWTAVYNDPDQAFRFVRQADGTYLVVNRTLNQCLDSTDSLASGHKPVFKPCKRGVQNQSWDIVPNGNGFSIQRTGTVLCLDETDTHVDGQLTQLWHCLGNDNQRVRQVQVSAPQTPVTTTPGTTPSNPGGSGPSTLIRTGGQEYVTIGNKQWFNVEIWMVARRRDRKYTFYTPTEGLSPGHAFIATVGRNRYTGRWEPIRTYSFWPDGESKGSQQPGTDLSVNHPTDYGHLEDILSDRSISDRGHEVRKAKVSGSRAVWFMKHAYKQTNCKFYPPLPLSDGFTWPSGYCHCAHYTTRMWKYVTSGWEDFKIEKLPGYSKNREKYSVVTTTIFGVIAGAAYEWWPDSLAESIKETNEQTGSDFLDNGNRWQ